MDSFPQRLRHWRLQRGLSQEQLGRRAGIGLNQISRLERGLARPLMRTVVRLATALDVEVTDLVEPDGEAA